MCVWKTLSLYHQNGAIKKRGREREGGEERERIWRKADESVAIHNGTRGSNRARLPHLSTPPPPSARRGMTTTTLQTTPLPGKEAGLRLQPIRTRKPQVSNLWGGRGSAGGGRGVVGEGRRPWEARTCGVRRRGEAAGVRLPRRRFCTLAAAESCCPVPLLPRAGPGLPPRDRKSVV